mgnify:CR=1 FL=1
MYTCTRCGRPTENFSPYSPLIADLIKSAGVSFCDACYAELADIRDWENEQFQTSNLVCPWCGHEDRDSWELADWDGSYECPACGKLFEYEREVEVPYTSRKREQDYPRGGVMPDAH